jgi:hypothetical protein
MLLLGPRPVSIAVCLLLLAGCGTPQPIGDLATRTSDHAVDLAIDLDQSAQRSASVIRQRADLAANLERSIALSRADLQQELALRKGLDDANAVARYEAINKLVSEARQQREAALAKVVEQYDSVLAEQGKVETDAAELRSLGGQLLEFSKDDSGVSRLEFLGDFAREVNEDLKKAQQAADDGANAAKAIADGTATVLPTTSKE